jgi:hypothetical protein
MCLEPESGKVVDNGHQSMSEKLDQSSTSRNMRPLSGSRATPQRLRAERRTAVQQAAFPDVKRLVRSELGCACPDHVFERIEILPAFAGLPGDHLITVGNRLLLLVINSSTWQEVLDQLGHLCTLGRQLRDAQGFNRFRLVVAVPEVAVARAALAGRFDAAVDHDDRMHLHVIRSQVLAAHGLAGDDTNASGPR